MNKNKIISLTTKNLFFLKDTQSNSLFFLFNNLKNTTLSSPSIYSYSTKVTTSIKGEENGTVGVTNLQLAEKDRESWLRSEEATRYENDPGTEGPFFITGNIRRPFPLNPFYVARRPMDNETRNEIYALWKKDPQQYTPKKLGIHFGLSVIRIEAILKLKAQEENFRGLGFPIHESLASNMDRLLGSQRRRFQPNGDDNKFERLRPHLIDRLRPFFDILSETESLTPEDAAKMLKRNPYSQKVQKLDMKASRVFKLDSDDIENDYKVIQKDEKTTSKFTFMITNPATKEMVVREKDGLLRTATALERWNFKKAKPAYRPTK